MPLVTIVIPTRNRQNCASTLVKKILNSVNDCEVVVCDNSDDENLGLLLAEVINDPRLVYTYYTSTLSVVENFNLGLDASQGDFVTFIGDDDLLGPDFERIVKWAKANDIDLLQSNSRGRALQYFWPGVKSKNWQNIDGSLYFSDFSGNIEKLDVHLAMKDAMFHLGCGPMNMPRAYLGLMSRKVLQKIHHHYGSLFGGFSPDVYSSQLLSNIKAKAFGIDYPLIIPGVCSLSTSAARSEGSDIGNLDNPRGLVANDHIGRFSSIVWDKRVPIYYAPYTVWAQSHLKALEKTHVSATAKAFAHLYATCLCFTPKQFREVFEAIRYERNLFQTIFMITLTGLMLNFVVGKYILEKFPLVIYRKPGGAKYQISDLSDSSEATNEMSSWFANNNIKFQYTILK